MAEPISQTNTPTIVANVDKGLASGNASFWENAARLNSATPLNAAESPEAFKVYQDIQQNPGRFISNTFDNFSGYEKQVLQKATIEANNSALKKRDPYIDIPRATPHSVEIYNPDKIDTFLPRYQNWDRGLFEQLGFDPNGGNDERYNAKSTAFMNFKRTLKGTGAIALETIGQNFVSYDDIPSALPGVDKTIDIEQASMADKAVKSIMSQYQLTHGGNAAEFGNDMMQAGFTIGSVGEAIITSIVADAVLLAMTPETAGASGALAAVTTAARFTNLVKKIKNVQKLMEVTKASSTIGKVVNTAGKLGFAPRTIGTIRNFGSIAKAGGTIRATGMLGVNIATDLAIAGNFTGEAGLEAGATFNETRDKLIEQYININGYEPKGEDYADILARATTAAQKDYNVNAYMLYAANKLNMGLLVRPHMAKIGYALGRYDGNIIDKGVKNRLIGRYAEYEHGRGILGIRRMAEDIEKVGFKKGFLKPAGVWIGEGAVEGLQEVWQEVATQSIQEHSVDDFLHDNDKLAAVGSWIDYINDAHQQVWDTEGTKLFLMGFMTQAVTMAPIQTMQSIVEAGGNAMQGRPQDTSNVGGWTMDKIENLIHRVKGKEEFEKYKTEKEKKLKQTKDIISKRTEILNEINKNPDLLFNPILQNMLSVHDFDTALKEMEANDMDATKVYHDIKDEGSFKYLQMLVQTNQVDAFKDTIRDIKANTTEDDIRKTYSSSTLTKVQYDKMLDKYVERLDRIEERKRNADNMFVNIYPTGSVLSTAFEGAKWSFILMGNRYDRALERMNKIYSLVYDEKFKDSLDKTVNITTFDSLFKSDVREEYIKSLETNIALATSSDTKVVTDELRSELQLQKDKLNVLRQIDSAVKNFEKEKDGKKFSNEIKKLFREHIAKGYDKKFSDKELDILANAITDYTVLGFEAKGLNENISILMNDRDVYNNIVNKEFEFFEKLKENRDILIDKILNATLKHNASQVVQVALDKAGIKVAITPNGLKAMNDKEQLPLRDNFIQYKEVDGEFKHEALSESNYEKAIALIKQIYADKGIILKDSLISKSKQDYSERETGSLTSTDDIIKRFGLDKQIVESNVGQVVSLRNLISAIEKRLFRIDNDKVGGTIVFCTNLEEPVKRKDGKLFIDIRFFSNNYVQEQNLSIDSFIEEELYKNYLGNIEKGSLAYLKIEQLVDEISKANKKVSGENVIASFSSLISNKKLLSSLNEDLRNELDTFFSNFRKFGDNLTKSESPVNKVVADIKKSEEKSEAKESEDMKAIHEINLDTIDKDSTISKEELVKEASSLKVEELEDFIKKYSSNPELKEAISSAFADDEVKKTAMAIFNRIEKESQEFSLDNAIAALASSAVQSCK